jgi:alpha-mannosidase
MGDEADVHYIDMIDQTTLGHEYIKEEFGHIQMEKNQGRR